MASAVNRVAGPSIFSSSLWEEVAHRLRRVTVEVVGPGGHHGAGVVWTGEGLIITNAHVVNGSSLVRLPDGRSYRAELVKSDRKEDLAALWIRARKLEAAQLRDSTRLRIGEMVVAVGHPMGVKGAASVGIVQASGEGWIGTDARLAPGNSGGPLADVQGRVIGINSMVVNGVGVAISTDAVERFLRRVAAASL